MVLPPAIMDSERFSLLSVAGKEKLEATIRFYGQVACRSPYHSPPDRLIESIDDIELDFLARTGWGIDDGFPEVSQYLIHSTWTRDYTIGSLSKYVDKRTVAFIESGVKVSGPEARQWLSEWHSHFKASYDKMLSSNCMEGFLANLIIIGSLSGLVIGFAATRRVLERE